MANTTNLNLSKLAGTEKLKSFPSPYNDNMDAIDGAFGADFGVSGKPSVNAELNSLGDGLAILANGNTHAAITSGQFVYVRGHGTLADGLYQATSNIAQDGTLSGSNLTADSSGGLNTVFSTLNSKFSAQTLSVSSLDTLKSSLLAKANDMAQYETKFVTFWVSGVTTGFETGKNYSGTITISSKTSNTLYFDVVLSAYNGDIVIVGYANGTWDINSLNSKSSGTLDPTAYTTHVTADVKRVEKRGKVAFLELYFETENGYVIPTATNFCNIPSGFRPVEDNLYNAMIRVGTTWLPYLCSINTSGQIKQSLTSNCTGISFSASYPCE